MPKTAKGLRGYSASFVRAVEDGHQSPLVARLARYCVQGNVSVTSVATRLGVTRSTVYSWFTGQSHPRARHQDKIHRLLIRLGQE